MPKRIYFDINILLDVLLDRDPFFTPAAMLWTRVEQGRIDGSVSALSLPTCYYLLRRLTTQRKAMSGIRAVRDVFDVVTLDGPLIDQAIDSGFADFEDAIQAIAAYRADAEYIVTRDAKGFRKSPVPTIDPVALLDLLTNETFD